MSAHSPLTRRLISDGCAPKRAFAEYPAPVRAAVEAYDMARCAYDGRVGEAPMSDANKATIAPMIMAACQAYIEAAIDAQSRAA